MAWEFNPTTGEFWWSGVASAGGSDTQIQYNNAGALDGGVGLTWNSGTSVLSTPNLKIDSTGSLAWSTDLFLKRYAAGQVAQYDGANPQGYLIFNTYTDGANYERFNLNWSANTFYIQCSAAGTGTLRPLSFRAASMSFYTGGAEKWNVLSSGSWYAATDNSYDVGYAQTVGRPRNGFFGTLVSSPKFHAYNTYTDASNYERGTFDWSTTANTLTIGTQKAGTGSTRSIQFDVGGSAALLLFTNLSATFYGNIYSSESVFATKSFQIGAGYPLYWASGSKIYGGLADGVVLLMNQAQTDFNRLQFGGTASSFPAIKRSTTTLQARLADDSAFTLLESSQIKTNNGTFLVSGTALTDGAAAAAGTLLNAPAAGNPTKWIPIDDNGTTRYIPCW